MVLVPAGEFVMGDAAGNDDEKPLSPGQDRASVLDGNVRSDQRAVSRNSTRRTTAASRTKGPGCSTSRTWAGLSTCPDSRSSGFRRRKRSPSAEWLSKRTGEKVTLPTEAQWEYACRGGTATPFSLRRSEHRFLQARQPGRLDHSRAGLRRLPNDQYPPDLVPRDARFNDGKLVTADVGAYKPNVWGLHDMHGNAWEWTRSAYRPIPTTKTTAATSRANDTIVVRGGSWYRPARAQPLCFPAELSGTGRRCSTWACGW